VNNLTNSVVTYQWDGQQVRDLAEGLVDRPLASFCKHTKSSSHIGKKQHISLIADVLFEILHSSPKSTTNSMQNLCCILICFSLMTGYFGSVWLVKKLSI